ncbi:hypothetical protein CEXT_148881 [Caerostris extrusa]|uniref:Uncharacterized protein n=1 Tax=Caerostris extrusa TaxID=172846 RepID=A0AAV4QH43_CAEEX|nr:hypothetical protein CEXT_148881 [Caerostris extrusa]
MSSNPDSNFLNGYLIVAAGIHPVFLTATERTREIRTSSACADTAELLICVRLYPSRSILFQKTSGSKYD